MTASDRDVEEALPGIKVEVSLSTDEDASLDQDTSTAKWRLFEQTIAAAEKELDEYADVVHDERLIGEESETVRQIDVFARGRVVRSKIAVVIECKRYANKLGIGKVDEFIGKLQDVGAHHGVLYAYSGVTRPALARAAGARRPTVEIRDFADTQAELDRVAQERRQSSSTIDYEDLISSVATQYGVKLAQDLESHFSYNCAAGTGCYGVVEMEGYRDEIAWGACDHCHSLHLRCECDEDVVFIHGNGGPEACWCGAEYEVSFTPERDLTGIAQVRHGIDCPGDHAPDVSLHPETSSAR
jgi:hypothetical protein